MPQILSKKKIKLIQATATEEEKELLKWRKKLYNKELFYKRKRKECLQQIHKIDRKLGLIPNE